VDVRAAIIDLSLPTAKQDNRGLAAQWLTVNLGRAGLKEHTIDDANIVLCTAVHPQAAVRIDRLRKAYPRAVYIVGGAAATSPASMGHICNVVLGDSRGFIEKLARGGIGAAMQCSNVWRDGDTARVEIDQSFPWDMPPLRQETGAVAFVCGRGCKHKCRFCQTSWAYTEQEHANPGRLVSAIKKQVKSGNKVNYISNDISAHAFTSKLPKVGVASMSIDYMRKNGLPPSRQVRIGVEGVSERLRAKCKKPTTTKDLVDCASWLNKNGRSVRWFFIAGLPGETEDDWTELVDAVQTWKRVTPKGVLALSFTAFCPDPATPWCDAGIGDGYYDRWLKFKSWFFDGGGWSNRVKLMAPQGVATLREKAAWSLGLSIDDACNGGIMTPNARVLYPYRKAWKSARLTGETAHVEASKWAKYR